MFIGREKELKQLNGVLARNIASMVVIRGRRRIGKSRLIKEFIKPFKSYFFMGLPPNIGASAKEQQVEFCRQFKEQFSFGVAAADWGDLFTLLAKQCAKTNEKIIIVFDEISWLATGDKNFLGKLKTAWDLHFTDNSNLVLILCGSVSAWIDKNILSNTGYLGRPSLHMTIDELPLEDCYKFWHNKHNNLSSFEILKVLAITGGVPRYLELINSKKTAEENITGLCFNASGVLYDEFQYIFSDIYGGRSTIYKKIVNILQANKSTRTELLEKTGIASGGDISEYLEDLRLGGFIAKEVTWDINSKKHSKLSKYRLRDNYTRFYLKYILPNLAKIEQGQFDEVCINNLPGWNTILGLQFENLVLNNSGKLIKLLDIQPEDIIAAGPYFQRKNTKQSGCQIDYLVQTKHDVIYVCEIKFKRAAINKSIIAEMQNKLQALKIPKYISKRAVLIHVNGVDDEVIDADYFAKIIDFQLLLI